MKTKQQAAPGNSRQPRSAGKTNEKSGFFSSGYAAEQHAERPFFEKARARPKMTVNEPGDHFEQQADRVADRVVKQINQPKSAAVPVGQAAAVQKKDDKKEEKQENERQKSDKQIQRRPIFESDADPDEGDTLKRQSRSAAPEVSPKTQQRIESSKGGGSPLPANTRRDMENAMGADLSGVRIHNDAEAASLSNELQAQAFTHGNDIYFGAGKYDTQSPGGQHLLAHEAAHTVQQGGGVQKKGLIQRTPESPTAGALSGNVGEKATKESPLDKDKKTLYVPSINIPAIKLAMIPGSTQDYAFKKTPRSNTHISVWNVEAQKGSKFSEVFDGLVKTQIPAEATATNFYMTLKSAGKGVNVKNLIIGTKDQIKAAITRPFWDKDGKPVDNGYDVDHKVELQLGGLDGLANLWLLSAGTNRSSGSKIDKEINDQVGKALTAASKDKNGPTTEDVRNSYTITAGKLNGSLSVPDGKGWEMADIQAAKHLEQLKFLSEHDKARERLIDNSHLSLITSERYGSVKNIKWDPKKPDADVNVQIGTIKRNGANVKITHINYPDKDNATILSAGSDGTVTLQAFMDNSFVEKIEQPLKIESLPGIYGGRLSGLAAKQAISSALKAKNLSPVTLDDLDINDSEGLVATGKIHTDIPFLNKADINLTIDQDGIKVSKVFNTGELNVPAPFKISDCSLEIYAATSGIGIKGQVHFEIKDLGKGQIGAMANSSGQFALSGEFNFESETFNPAKIKVSYVKPGSGTGGGGFSASGDIGIPAGKIKGLKKADIHIEYANETFNATGHADPDIKGVKQAEIHVTYGNETLVIGGSFTLDENLPGIQSGGGNVEVTRGSDGIYHVKASGEAVPKIPKINTKLHIDYDDGALTVEGTAAYTADRVSGNVKVGATNRAIAADGTPSGPAGEHFTAYGSGTLTLKITDWLQASATVRVTPAGEIEVVGRIELPSAVDVFARQSMKKELFHMPTIQIPLFAIPLGPKSIGLVATIGGGLDFEAGIGPGQLRNVFGEIQFNPSHPEQTVISGGAEFVIPANASISLHADLGIGLSIGPASVTGGIQVRGGLGLEGEAKASANLAWSPTQGFEFNALGEIEVHPQFTFDVNAFLKAELDLWLYDISKEWTHNLASFKFGPQLEVKVSMPIHYKDGEPFHISMDDIHVTYPNIDIGQIAGGLADKVKEEIL